MPRLRSADQQRRKLHANRVSYAQFFDTPAGKQVISDLAEFCHMYDTTHVTGDPYGSAQLEGRRQVFLRIIGNSRLTPEQVEAMVEHAIEEEG